MIWQVARNAVRFFDERLHTRALQILTPLAAKVPLNDAPLSPSLREFLQRYEPRVATEGLYPHQADFLRAFAERRDGDFLVTTATGSGKSLCFWAWIFEHLRRDPEATALVCFPTQALMWGQAERLARISAPDSLAYPQQSSTAYGGQLPFGDSPCGWTIWQGVGSGETANQRMKLHEPSTTFRQARIRVATLDKAHWSLLSKAENREFARRLACLVLDEAHLYDGVFGANVHFFLQRVYLSSTLQRRSRPRLLLASATLGQPREFACSLLAVPPTQINLIEDAGRSEVSLVEASQVPKLLQKPSADALVRYVLLVDDPVDGDAVCDFSAELPGLGPDVNAIYFSASKYSSRLLKRKLLNGPPSRQTIIYDADLPPEQRRELENQMNASTTRGLTVLGTSALELGVDIDGLDVCLMDDLPPRRASLLQRIGRVGRRLGRPGLAILRVSAAPFDRELLEDPVAGFQMGASRALPIPVHLESLRWRHLLAAYEEWIPVYRRGVVSADAISNGLEIHFRKPRELRHQELKEQFRRRYGAMADMEDHFWVYRGFRAAAGEGKIPLRDGRHEVARIDEYQIFRDAHPGAVYLGHDLKHYQVINYNGPLLPAAPASSGASGSATDRPSLGKWLKSLRSVDVAPVRRSITTRGRWLDSCEFVQELAEASPGDLPRDGTLQFGMWDQNRRWDGFVEFDLRTGKRRVVELDEATRMFAEALDSGRDHPFLLPLSYRTLGWQWDFGPISVQTASPEATESLMETVGALLTHFLAATVESTPEDLQVEFSLSQSFLRVLDNLPGGNGLSDALLHDHRTAQALEHCRRELSRFVGKGPGKATGMQKYLIALQISPGSASPRQLLDVVEALTNQWGRWRPASPGLK